MSDKDKKKSGFQGPAHLKPKFTSDDVKKFEDRFKQTGWSRKVGKPTKPKDKK
jgi:hypothetical protein